LKTLLSQDNIELGFYFPRDEDAATFDREPLILELARSKADPSDQEEWAEALFHYELLSDLQLVDAYQDLYGY
jgi:hypothetical protein